MTRPGCLVNRSITSVSPSQLNLMDPSPWSGTSKGTTYLLKSITFSHYLSNRKISILYGTPMSQLLPYLYVHSDALSAQNSVLALVTIMTVEKGFPSREKLIHKMRHLLLKGAYPGLLYSPTDIHL